MLKKRYQTLTISLCWDLVQAEISPPRSKMPNNVEFWKLNMCCIPAKFVRLSRWENESSLRASLQLRSCITFLLCTSKAITLGVIIDLQIRAQLMHSISKNSLLPWITLSLPSLSIVKTEFDIGLIWTMLASCSRLMKHLAPKSCTGRVCKSDAKTWVLFWAT